jgi:hypothetical protein
MAPPKPLYFLTHYTATKNSFTLLEITIGQEKIHGCPHNNVSIIPHSYSYDCALYLATAGMLATDGLYQHRASNSALYLATEGC